MLNTTNPCILVSTIWAIKHAGTFLPFFIHPLQKPNSDYKETL